MGSRELDLEGQVQGTWLFWPFVLALHESSGILTSMRNLLVKRELAGTLAFWVSLVGQSTLARNLWSSGSSSSCLKSVWENQKPICLSVFFRRDGEYKQSSSISAPSSWAGIRRPNGLVSTALSQTRLIWSDTQSGLWQKQEELMLQRYCFQYLSSCNYLANIIRFFVSRDAD